MKLTIELNSHEVARAVTNGLLNALAEIDLCSMEDSTAKAQSMPPQTAMAPSGIAETVPVAATEPVQQEIQASVPTEQVTYSQEDLALAATQLVDCGKQQVVVDLLARFGVAALTQLPQEQYGAFATALKGMGAKL